MKIEVSSVVTIAAETVFAWGGIEANAYDFYTAREITPAGWLADQLRVQNQSLVGNLHQVWPDIRDSKWIGGNRDGWERVPYWLDGFAPMAFLLRDPARMATARRYVDAILDRQAEDGWICPCDESERGKYDMWAYLLICKSLVTYYECSGDARIEGAIEGALKCLHAHLQRYPLDKWGKWRWYEGLVSIHWLYERTGEAWLKELAALLREQGVRYDELFKSGEATIAPIQKDWTFEGHGVNVAMAFKEALVNSRFAGERDKAAAQADFIWDFMMRHHGTALGFFTADECFSGHAANQGVELCAVVESMYSFALNFAISGDVKWLDRLETLGFNHLPATTSPDMWTHQYVQMTNQIACIASENKPYFPTTCNSAHTFGLEPACGCCTANMAQGWPKLALATFMKGRNGVLAAVLAPARLQTAINGVDTTVEMKTMYPFRNSVTFEIKTEKPVEFDLEVRIPSWADDPKLDGVSVEPGSIAKVSRKWQGDETVTLILPEKVEFHSDVNNQTALRRGALFYSLPMDEKWTRSEGVSRWNTEYKFPYCNYEISSETPWSYAWTGTNVLGVAEHTLTPIPWSNFAPPVTLDVVLAPIDWGTEDGLQYKAARIPKSTRMQDLPVKVTLQPYGSTNLRITALPLVEAPELVVAGMYEPDLTKSTLAGAFMLLGKAEREAYWGAVNFVAEKDAPRNLVKVERPFDEKRLSGAKAAGAKMLLYPREGYLAEVKSVRAREKLAIAMESGTSFNEFVAALVKKPDVIIVNDALDLALLKAAVLGDFSHDSYKNLWVRQNPLKPIVYPSTATFLGSDDSHMTNNYADAAKRAEGSDFRVLSYNLLHGEWGGFHESLRKDAVIDVIRHLSPDVMGLQEITGEWYRHLGEAFKGRYRWAEVPDSLHNLMYNALMYNERKFRQVDGGVIPFQNDLRLRSIHWMLLEEHESKRRMIVANTHWFGQPELQTLAADVMVKEIARLRKTYDVPVFIAGDYNATYKDAAFDRLLALSGLNDSFVASGNKENSTTRSWVDNNFNEVPARNSLHIDHIVFGGAAKIVGAHLVYKKSLMDASDHLPLVADFKLPAAKAKAELD